MHAENDLALHHAEKLGGIVLVQEENLIAGSRHSDVKAQGSAPRFFNRNSPGRQKISVASNECEPNALLPIEPNLGVRFLIIRHLLAACLFDPFFRDQLLSRSTSPFGGRAGRAWR